MAKFTIKQISTTGFDELIKHVETSIEKFKMEVRVIGDETTKHMKDVIEGSKKRPIKDHTDTNPKASKQSLSKTIDVEFFPGNTGFGIGNIEKLKQFSPHFLAINYGSRHIVGKPVLGKFVNGIFVWKPSEGGKFMIPKNPIPAMNYLQKASDYLVRRLEGLGKALGGK